MNENKKKALEKRERIVKALTDLLADPRIIATALGGIEVESEDYGTKVPIRDVLANLTNVPKHIKERDELKAEIKRLTQDRDEWLRKAGDLMRFAQRQEAIVENMKEEMEKRGFHWEWTGGVLWSELNGHHAHGSSSPWESLSGSGSRSCSPTL